MDKPRPALREPMVWLVIALPLAAVIASVALVITSIRGGSIDAVIDTVHRTGQIQTTDLGPDARASQLRLSVVLQAEDGVLRVFPASGEFARDAGLQLTLAHPQEQDADQVVALVTDELGWHAKLPLDHSHDWTLQLTDTPTTWRLRGRLPRGQHAARLGPSLDAK